MNKKLIEALKKNEKPFGLLSEPEQKCLRNNIHHLERYGGAMGWNEWCASFGFIEVVRIKTDYKPEPEIVECGVYVPENGNRIRFYYQGYSFPLEGVISHKDWYGLKWSDGVITIANDLCGFRRTINGELEWPTHVLMKELK